jgi:hypothetical protein
MLASGRNSMMWAGRDVILRAKQSADISATDHDVRIKAQKNVLVTSGISGTGGIMLESCATAAANNFSGSGQAFVLSGIWMHAPCSEIIGVADSIYLRTDIPSTKGGSPGYSAGAARHGDIVLDAARGCKNVSTISQNVLHFVNCAVAHIFGMDASDGVTYFTTDGAVIAGNCYIDGALINKGDHSLDGNVVATGHIYTSRGGAVGQGGSAAAEPVAGGHAYEQQLITWGDARWDQEIEAVWYASGRPGNTSVLVAAWFGFRSQTDYGSGDFVLYESRWAQMDRMKTNAAPHWTEGAVVDGTNATTMPFPGTNQLAVANSYFIQDTYLYDMTKGTSKDRGAMYETPVYATPVGTILNCNYPIVG